jgi:hypothetical protein
MGYMSFDTETYLLFPAFALGTGATLGLISADFVPFINLGDVVLEFGTIEWTVGRVIAALALLAVLFNRQASITDTRGIDLWVTYATLGLILAPPFFPAFAETLAEQPASWIAFTVQSVGFAIVTYVN